MYLSISGIVVGHVTPEAQCGGPIAIVENNDLITIDPEMKTIDLVCFKFRPRSLVMYMLGRILLQYSSSHWDTYIFQLLRGQSNEIARVLISEYLRFRVFQL